MQAKGQLFVHNSTCPLDTHEFQDDLAFALANATRATNVTAVLDHCYSSYTAANYTLTLPIDEAGNYDDELSALSAAVATELRNRGYNNSGAEMLVTKLLFNPVDGVECVLKSNDSACQNGKFLRRHEITSPAKFGGNCTVPEPIILSCITSSDSGLSARQIAGIVIGTVVGFFLLLCVLLCLIRNRVRSRRASKEPANRAPESAAVKT